jgi:hypothetical protein
MSARSKLSWLDCLHKAAGSIGVASPALIAGLVIALAGSAATAQSSSASQGPATELTAGTARLAIERGEATAIHAVGSTATIVLRAGAVAAGMQDDAEILIEAESGLVQAIGGRGLRATGSGGTPAAKVLLPKGRPQTLYVETRFLESAPAETRGESRLRITLSSGSGPAKPSSTALVVFGTSDCSGNYQRRLAALASRPFAGARQALKAAPVADPQLPGRWLLAKAPAMSRIDKSAGEARVTAGTKSVAPAKPAAREVVCLKEEPGNPGSCIQLGHREGVRQSQPSPFASDPQGGARSAERLEQALLQYVQPIVAARGAIPDLDGKGRLAVAAMRTAADLEAYVRQPRHPELCTGVGEMLDYFALATKTLEGQIALAGEAAEVGRDLARRRVAALHLTIKSADPRATSRHVTPATAPDTASEQLSGLVHEVAALVLDPAGARAVAAVKAPLPALVRLADALRTPPARALSEPAREAMTAALAVLEAAAYAELGHARYRAVDGTLFAGMSAIRQAHAGACICAR